MSRKNFTFFSIKNILVVSGICLSNPFFAQLSEAAGNVHGNFQFDGQYLYNDTATGSPNVNERSRYNAFGNINYISGGFSMGFRYESYNPVMLGFLSDYSNRSGIPYRYARYQRKDIDITVGNFYEQFGSGLSYRTYEDRGLLYDNAMDGFRAIVYPYKGITLKGVIGRQRVFWGLSDGVIKGVDGEVNITQLFDSIPLKTQFIIGGSFVSKYQDDKNPSLVLPKNVGCYSTRLNIINESFNLIAEYAYKINDPSYQNQYSYKDGQALYVSASYAMKGFSALLSAKYIDNMNYKSERDNNKPAVALMNFMPALTKPHTYLMMAYYPYASQPNGEVGGMTELQYKVKKGSLLGGKYGTDINLNASISYGTDTTRINDLSDTASQYKYSVNTNGVGDKYFHDINIEISRKLSKKWKFTFMYANQFINQSIVQYGTPDKEEHPDVYANIFVADVTFKYKTGAALRSETQLFLGDYRKGDESHLSDAQKIVGNTGNWIVETIEWTPVSNWFIVLVDQFNYENPLDYKKLHYYYAGLTYVTGPSRIGLSYGRQRQGIFCAGGVCRLVPAFTGFQLSISSSF